MILVHQKMLKAASLGDKEGLRRLTALYYDTPQDLRPTLLEEIVKESNKTRAKLKELELQKLQEEECRIGQIVDIAEEAIREKTRQTAGQGEAEVIRGEGSGGDDEAAGEGGEPSGQRGGSLPDDAPRL